MEERQNPNDVLTPTYVGEQLVYVPLLVFYLGAQAIADYIARQEDEHE